MILINEHYLKLSSSYLFSDIARRVQKIQFDNPERDIIKMGIGDVTLPLPSVCIEALHRAVDELSDSATFRGYGPEQGYGFLREKIAAHDFQARGADVFADEIFVSDGAKCDTGNIQELFNTSIRVALPDPVYPVYVDTNVMAGRTGSFANGRYQGLVYLDSLPENDFIPDLPREQVDLIYLCYPNNPTGAGISKKELQKWVDYALHHKALILFDAAYEAFIRDPEMPHSIFEIPGAREIAVEFRSFSKTAGFTGTRCAYTVVPKDCKAYDRKGDKTSVHELWNRRHSTKFNGVSYPVQRAAEAVYTREGQDQIRKNIDYYLNNAGIILKEMQNLDFVCSGGENSPYIWVQSGSDSWSLFDDLLNKAGVVCTPGTGFGSCGEGFIRLSAFNTLENIQEAMQRIKEALS